MSEKYSSPPSIVNTRTNKGPVVYPHVSKQVMTTSSTSTPATVHNTTIMYQKGFLPIPGVMSTSATSSETTTAVQPNQERRNGFSTTSQEVDNQIPSTPGVKVVSYDPLVTPISGEARYPTYEQHFPAAVTSRPYTFDHISSLQNSVYQQLSYEENDISSQLQPALEFEHSPNIENGNFHHHLQQMHHMQQQQEEKHENQESFFGTMMGILGALIPLGVLISALNPNYVVINPNTTAV